METESDTPGDTTSYTSPSQLQEVTLDPDSTTFTYMGIQTPAAAAGRSVKDFEEQLTNLRKENFNLKLRIYFLEERMGANFNIDKENAIKKNIELSVELESLRKEVEEKQELLCQAVKAMELEEEEHRKDVNARDKEIENLREELKNLHQNAQVALQTNDSLTNAGNQLTLYAAHLQLDNAKASDILHDLQTQILELEKALKKERNRGDHLERLLAAADCESIRSKELEVEIRRKDNRLASVEQELKDSTYKICALEDEVHQLQKQAAVAIGELEIKTRELKKKEQELAVHDNQMDELKRALLDAEGQMDAEQRKTEKYRCSLTKRNTLLSEKEVYIERLETKIRQLESCLKEVKGASPGRRSKLLHSNNNDVDSFISVQCSTTPSEFSSATASTKDYPSQLTPNNSTTYNNNSNNNRHHHYNNSQQEYSPHPRYSAGDFVTSSDNCSCNVGKLRQELDRANEEITRLKKEQYKAIKMMKAMILTRREHTEKIEHLKAIVDEKQQEIEGLHEKIATLEKNANESGLTRKIETSPAKSLSEKPIYQKINELNLTAALSPTANNENSMSETAEGTSQLCEQYKTLSNELEKQVQILIETLNQKDFQLNSYKEQCESQLCELKEKQNRIIDLEFELLSTTQEKSDACNEKECSFWKKELAEKDKEISRLEIELRKRTGDLQTIVNKELWEKNREIEKLQKRYGNLLEVKDKQVVELKKEIGDKESQLTLLKDKISELGAHIAPEIDLLPVKDNEEFFPENKSLEERFYRSLQERKELIKQVENFKQHLKNSSESQEIAALKDELEKSEKLRHDSQDICSVLSTRLEELCQFLDSLLKQKSVLGFLGNKQKSHLRKIIDQSLDLSRTLSMSISLNPNQSLLQLSNLSNLLDLTHETNESINSPEETSLSILPGEVSLTYQNHLRCINTDSVINSDAVTQQAEIIKILREQVENLKKEIELRDTELENKARNESKELKNDQEFVEAVIDLQSSLSESPKHLQSPQKILQELFTSKSPLLGDKSALNTTSTTLKNVNTENQSESECWSEPDRKVSMQRMGIIDEKTRTGVNSSLSGRRSRFSYMECPSTESTEDERNISLSRTPSKRSTIVALHEQICELEDKLKDKEKQLLAAQIDYFETEKALKEEKAKVHNYMKQEEQLVSKMKSTEDKLREAEERYETANKKLEDNNSVIATLEQFKSQMEIKDKEVQNRINELEKEKDMALKAVEEAEKLADNAKNDIKNAESKLRELQDELAQIEAKTRQNLEEEYKIKLRNMENDFQSQMKRSEEEYKSKLQSLEHECESQIKSIRKTIASIKESCAEDQKRNSDLTSETTEVEFIMDELEGVRQSVRSLRAKVKDMEENEELYKQDIHKLEVQYEEKIKSLYTQLDTVGLQHSETLLEKTKLMNEKTALEQEVQKYIRKEEELIRQVNDFQREFMDIRHSFQKQLSYLENLKVSLEAKVTQLESSNADLRRRIMSSGNINLNDDSNLSYSLPSSPAKYADLYPNKTLPIRSKKSVQYFRQLSDTAPGDLGDTKGLFNVVQLQAPNVMEMEHDARQGNSSPDLGIESDQGRFSSLEANVNIPRPLLPTLELTESMNNLLDSSVPVQDSFCNNENCIMKIKEMMNENSELKKRLLRTRRALEETVTQLTLANKRKKEVEKTICKQIHKTSQVLRKAKANLDSGSESELLTNKK